MKTTSSKQLSVALRHAGWASSMALALFAFAATTPIQAAPRSKMSKSSNRVGVAQAERIARNSVGRGSHVVRNEGLHNGVYRIHVHRNGVAHHIFVNARTGRVAKTLVVSPRADLREDGPKGRANRVHR